MARFQPRSMTTVAANSLHMAAVGPSPLDELLQLVSPASSLIPPEKAVRHHEFPVAANEGFPAVALTLEAERGGPDVVLSQLAKRGATRHLAHGAIVIPCRAILLLTVSQSRFHSTSNVCRG